MGSPASGSEVATARWEVSGKGKELKGSADLGRGRDRRKDRAFLPSHLKGGSRSLSTRTNRGGRRVVERKKGGPAHAGIPLP